MHCRMSSSILSLYLLNAGSTPHPTSSSARWDNQKTTPDIAQCPQGSGAGGEVRGTRGKDTETKIISSGKPGTEFGTKTPLEVPV